MGVLCILSTTAQSLEARGWRLTFTQSIANDTPIVVSEIEWLYDDDGDPATPLADATFGDLGKADCGWTRTAPNLTGNTGTISVGCDSVAVSKSATTTITGVRRTRMGFLMFDNNFASSFQTSDFVSPSNGVFQVQYVWYIGIAAPGRTLKDVEAYTVTVPTAFLGPGENGFAPSIWTVEYLDATGRWVKFEGADISAANFNDGTEVDANGVAKGETGFTTTVGKRLFFRLP